MRNSHLITGIEVHVTIAGRGITSLNVLSWRYQLRRETCSVAGWNFRKASDTGTQIPRLFLWQISIPDISCIAINVDTFYKYITICLKFCMLHICVCWGRFCAPPRPPTHPHTPTHTHPPTHTPPPPPLQPPNHPHPHPHNGVWVWSTDLWFYEPSLYNLKFIGRLCLWYWVGP